MVTDNYGKKQPKKNGEMAGAFEMYHKICQLWEKGKYEDGRLIKDN